MAWDDWWDGRGHPSQHDPGPPANRSWSKLFAEVPNYRGLGRAVTGRESFRWHFGPMFYRGRLGDNQVKVLIVGQEGAQDESLSHRSFTGGTGSRMQHVLNHLGITDSYLFLNTFCYPIFGQYGAHLRWLAQDPRSPIAAHRNDVFDYVVKRNELQLVVAVGTAAKESVASWLESHGIDADAGHLERADASSISGGLRTLGVLHPGGATGGGATRIKADFVKAIKTIGRWRRANPGWLEPDPGATALPASQYRYSSAPIPFRDFPFGTAWRLGRGGTSSNRKDAQRSIQMFSAAGKYNGSGDKPSYSSAASGSDDGYDDHAKDRPYEPPRSAHRSHDRGPDPQMAGLLTPQWPSLDHGGAHESFGFGPIYRGRLQDVTMLILADPASDDDLFTARALTGEAGQHLQEWMRSAGIDEQYLILRVPPFSADGSSVGDRNRWVDHPDTVSAYRAIIDLVRERSPKLTPVVTVGPMAGRLASRLDLDSVAMNAHGRRGWLDSWNESLALLEDVRYRKDVRRPGFRYDGRRGQIPREDLPYGTLRWQGSSGDRAVQARVRGAKSGDYYKIFVPKWVFDLDGDPLTASEQKAVDDA